MKFLKLKGYTLGYLVTLTTLLIKTDLTFPQSLIWACGFPVGVELTLFIIHKLRVEHIEKAIFKEFGGVKETFEIKNKYMNFSFDYVKQKASLSIKNIDFKTGIVTMKVNKGSYKEINVDVLERIFNKSISSLELVENKKNMVNFKISKVKESKYTKLEKGSLERLNLVLEHLKLKPEYISSQENETEISHSFKTAWNPNKIQRSLIDIEHKLGLKKNYLTFDHDFGQVDFKIKKDLTKIYILDDIIADLKKPSDMDLPFVLGVDSSGTVQIEDIVNTKHLLIAGKTGSGKSCTFKGILETLMYWNQDIAFYMLDFAESALTRYESFQNVKYLESDFESVTKGITEILEAQSTRMQKFRDLNCENIQEYNKLTNDKIPYIILAIDEANGFKEEWDKKDFEVVEKQMKIILKRGRKYGIYTIHAVQQTNDNDYVKSWRTQFTRIGHLLEDLCDANNLTNKKTVAEKIPKLGVGEFYLINDENCKKLKGCLTNKKYDLLYTELKGAYGHDKEVIKINEKNEDRQEQTATDKRESTNDTKEKDQTACNR